MKTSKLLALFIVSLMLASVFFSAVIADNELEVEEEKELTESQETQSEATDQSSNAQLTNKKETKSIKQSIEERVTKKKELLERAKKVREDSKEAFKTAKDELKEARQKLKDSKENFVEVKKELEKCKEIQSDTCKKSRKDAKSHSAKLVDGATEHIYRVLERASKAIENSDLTDDEKASVNAQISEKLEQINALRQTQGQVQAQSTVKEIKDAAKKVNEFWKANKEFVKENNAKIISAKLGGVIAKTQSLKNKLDEKVELFKSEGKDTADIESKIAQFNEKLSNAQALNEEVKALLASVSSSDDKSSIMKQATSKIKDAHAQLKEAHSLLKEIRNSIKNQETLSAGLQDSN